MMGRCVVCEPPARALTLRALVRHRRLIHLHTAIGEHLLFDGCHDRAHRKLRPSLRPQNPQLCGFASSLPASVFAGAGVASTAFGAAFFARGPEL